LRLGKAQNTDFYGQTADATTLITYTTILTLYKRFEAYETPGALFRDTQAEMLEKTFCERIAIAFIKIVADLLEILSPDVEHPPAFPYMKRVGNLNYITHVTQVHNHSSTIMDLRNMSY
jgi:hypothetical protein